MSETQRTFSKGRAIYLLICGAFLLLIGVLFFLRQSSLEVSTLKVKVVPVETPVRRFDVTPVDFDFESYYRPILDYNLFRPLGWTPPRPQELYRLLGTILPRDANTPPQAILQSTAGQKTYIVSTGEKIDASTEVVSIEGKQVTLSTNGEQHTLYLPRVF